MSFPSFISGQRIALIPLERTHAEQLFESGNDHSIWNYMPDKVDTLEDMNRIIESALQSKELGLEYPFTVIDSTSGKLIGSTRFLNISLPNKNL